MASLTFALTGNIACGKSTVTQFLGNFGAFLIDADRLAHKYLDGPARKYVIKAFGDDIVRRDSTIDRYALARHVFSDAERKSLLEQIIWPFVFDGIREARESHVGIVVWEAAQAIEALYAGYPVRQHYDALILVCASPQAQKERLQVRGLSEADINKRIAAQMSQEQKAMHAQYIIHDDGSRDDLALAVTRLWHDISHAPF